MDTATQELETYGDGVSDIDRDIDAVVVDSEGCDSGREPLPTPEEIDDETDRKEDLEAGSTERGYYLAKGHGDYVAGLMDKKVDIVDKMLVARGRRGMEEVEEEEGEDAELEDGGVEFFEHSLFYFPNNTSKFVVSVIRRRGRARGLLCSVDRPDAVVMAVVYPVARTAASMVELYFPDG